MIFSMIKCEMATRGAMSCGFSHRIVLANGEAEGFVSAVSTSWRRLGSSNVGSVRCVASWSFLRGCKLYNKPRILYKQRKGSNSLSVTKLSTTDQPIQDFDVEDMEDMEESELEKLFENFGEVMREEAQPRSTSSEVDDDAESLAFAVALAEAANEVKAGDIRVLCVKPLVYWTRFFVIATGFSRPQVDAIGNRIRDLAEQRYKRTARGDLKPNAWTLLDFGDVVVHVFFPKERAYYNLEEFYGNAALVELPFESEGLTNDRMSL